MQRIVFVLKFSVYYRRNCQNSVPSVCSKFLELYGCYIICCSQRKLKKRIIVCIQISEKIAYITANTLCCIIERVTIHTVLIVIKSSCNSDIRKRSVMKNDTGI